MNYPNVPDEWVRVSDAIDKTAYSYKRAASNVSLSLDQIINYATPSYATAVLVSAQGVERVRTAAESHRRIAIIEVMGRRSGHIALGAAYGQPDMILIPEHSLDIDLKKGLHVEGYDANRFRDRWGHIHPRFLHPALYNPKLMKPSRLGVEYLLPIFTDAIGSDDAEHMRQTVFDPGNLAQPYHSINTDVHKRIRYLEENSHSD